MYNSPFTPTISSEEIAEKLDELTELIEAVGKLTAQVERQDAAIAELRAEILSLRPQPIRHEHDLDTAQVELR